MSVNIPKKSLRAKLMKLYAISDLHLETTINREALLEIQTYPEDWLILGGDVCNTLERLEWAFEVLSPRFRQLLWVPGNHELWLEGEGSTKLGGEAKYWRLIELCRQYHVLTPEDPYVPWPDPKYPCLLAPLFLLYDYTFRPDTIPREKALAWAAESGIGCSDEYYLLSHPYPSKEAWCHQRLLYTEKRLQAVLGQAPLIVINHYPLRYDLVRLYRIPRFSLWCGTQATENWHLRFSAAVVVSGHLHMRATDYRDGVRFEEVSLGYAKHWDSRLPIDTYLREIWPGPTTAYDNAGPFWRNVPPRAERKD